MASALEAALQSAEAAIRATFDALSASDARVETLARPVVRRRGLLRRGEIELEAAGAVFPLGVLLLGAARGLDSEPGELVAAGTTTRAIDPGHPNFQSVSAEERRAWREAAARGAFREGEALHIDYRPISLDAEAFLRFSGPLSLSGDSISVRWSRTSAMTIPLDAYLRERADLLMNPPRGAM